MQVMMKSCRGMSFLVGLHADRIVMLGVVMVGLLAGAFVGSVVIQP